MLGGFCVETKGEASLKEGVMDSGNPSPKWCWAGIERNAVDLAIWRLLVTLVGGLRSTKARLS